MKITIVFYGSKKHDLNNLNKINSSLTLKPKYRKQKIKQILIGKRFFLHVKTLLSQIRTLIKFTNNSGKPMKKFGTNCKVRK